MNKTPDWAKKVNSEWEKRERVIEEYQRVLENSKKGFTPSQSDVNAIEEYKKRFPSAKIPEQIELAIGWFEQAKANEMTSQEKFEDARNGAIVDTALSGASHLITRDGGIASQLGMRLEQFLMMPQVR
ncbi:hypothetical protein [Streptococcus pluranimalium]|uniref:Uncharacterized protein n=1 Tax=Streptococcus pluranimalium TaxID=82348 RepID=A0A345VJK5_9STRE|nr:hypothetical protein [Streptococcus pluranimalium]AXJ12907.1 hypothetical protein Sp14A_09860 [Streptococcus pluranimalium]